MKNKIIITTLGACILAIVVYLEQNSSPFNNLNFMTNNSSKKNITTKSLASSKQTNPLVNKPQAAQRDPAIALPNFALKVIGNKKINQVNDIQAKKLIIHFWASWCNICASEFKDIVTYTKKYPNTTVLAISIDDDRDDLGTYLDSLEHKYHLSSVKNLMFSWDQDKSLAYEVFGTEAVPENYIADNNLNGYSVNQKTIGKVNWSKLVVS